MQQNKGFDETMTLADALARVLASDQPGVVTGYVTAEEQLETAAVLSEAGASDALVVCAMAVLAGAVKTPQRDSALWASGWAAAAELLTAEKDRDDAWITAAYVTALLHCDERRRKTRVHTAVLNWAEAAADAGAVWRLVTLLKVDAARFELPEAERAADALRAALLREFPCWWVVTLAETAAGHAMLPDIFRHYDLDAVVKMKGVWWVKIRNAEEERVLTSIAAHWAGGVTVKRFPGWPDEGSLPAKRPVTRVEWVKRRRLMGVGGDGVSAEPPETDAFGTSREPRGHFVRGRFFCEPLRQLQRRRRRDFGLGEVGSRAGNRDGSARGRRSRLGF